MIDRLPMAYERTLPPEVVAMPARMCPRCGVKSNFNLRFGYPVPSGHQVQRLDVCQNCNEGSYFVVDPVSDQVTDMYPKTTVSLATEIPESVQRPFLEAIRSFDAGCPNASLCMSRRALDDALTELGAPAAPNLPTRLNYLVANYLLTPALKDVADQARIGGKLAAHGTGGTEWGSPQKDWGDMTDAKDVIEYLSSVFEYAFVMPKRVDARRKGTPPSPVTQSGTSNNAPSL